MTNSGTGEGIFKDLLETLLKDKYTPIEWEGYAPYDKLPPRPPLKQHKQVAVDPIVLQRYFGRYRIPKDIAPDIILTVRWEGNHLSVQENDEPKQDLLPQSATQSRCYANVTTSSSARSKMPASIPRSGSHLPCCFR
jgi:hypothetical protein